MSNHLLQLKDVSVTFSNYAGSFAAVENVSLALEPGCAFGLVGESGCGKSLTARSILRLIPHPGRISGEIFFAGHDLLKLDEENMRQIRGRKISMIFQEPMTALNPVFKVGAQVMEPLRLHMKLSAHEAREHAADLFRQVGIASPEARLDDYPHQLSGGMRQRVMIAMALACGPELLLADEPTTALDVTIQGQILNLMKELREKNKMAVMLITHNLGVVAQFADEIGVMYAGRLIERSKTGEIFSNPLHPYTQGLMKSAPRLDAAGLERLPAIAGFVPKPGTMSDCCAFHPRCPKAFDVCRKETPPVFEPGQGHNVSCWLYG